jgi:hypothetical protein
LEFAGLGIDAALANNLTHLRSILIGGQIFGSEATLSTTDLHDLTCFILHRLLSMPSFTHRCLPQNNISECLRYGVAIYMFLIHGPTYYSHAHLLASLVHQLKVYLAPVLRTATHNNSLLLWLLSVGSVASIGTSENEWFHANTTLISEAMALKCWDGVEAHFKEVLWFETEAQMLFRRLWGEVFAV